ncbi:threonine--tRNA ligase [Enteractinococcus fodinae]|uniref:Threonine--tRNA ligase n=1 Tax=Enteractinococcus fodinae TaxID=684663 RepID=A0ABU2B2P2_9MICC|nr:threonine--tRNA ligase [Enteractinococcus fodinae]MDR7347058.1 threonyl-tRNA synthetase [Enteractinococcus fodinae]
MAEPQEITITVDDQTMQVAEGTTGTELFGAEKTTVVMKVNGTLQDLFRAIPDGATVERVDITDQEGLEVLRHSTAHVLAQAVQELYPDAKLGIGPYIEDGFYYDFDVDEPFTPEDLKQIQKRMMRIVKAGQTFDRRAVDEAKAREELANEPYKLQLLDRQHDEEAAAEGASVEIGAGDITIYDNLDRKGEVVWYDLCRGPHIPSTKLIANGFSLTRAAGAYWLGSENNPQLQRIYGTAWASKEDLVAYQERIAEAERRDHRKIGAEMDLFSFPDELGSGLPVFHPKGGILRKEMEDYSRQRHEEAGYEFVYTPHITKQNLYETSGHLEWYAEGMFPPMHVDEVRDEDTGEVTRAGADYYLKPMNCPMHNLIFASRGRSYRELPLRLFEFGSVYRYEKSGVIHGLTRVRGMTQDDAHIYCTEDQMKDELTTTLNFVLDLLKDYGLDDFYLELSSKDPEKYVGSDEVWDNATQVLAEVATESGLELVDDPGGAAFYGPKISVQARDALGRTWQMSTIQLDFNLPERFDLEYQAADGTRQRPVMIHRALFGSIERFMGVLTEHYAGAFPAWLAPEQVIAIPVADAFNDYLFDIVDKLKARGIRARVDSSSDRFPKKIRTAAKHKAPFVLIAGGEDAEANAVSFRYRDGSQDNGVPVDDAIERIVAAVEQRQQV